MSERDRRGQHLRTCEQGPECLEATREAIWQDFATQRATREPPATTSSSHAIPAMQESASATVARPVFGS